jgi:hypothetical protein
MVRRKKVPRSLRVKYALARDLVALRVKLFGDHGAGEMARRMGLPVRTWHNYEHGSIVPAEVVLKLMQMFPAEAHFGQPHDTEDSFHFDSAPYNGWLPFSDDPADQISATKYYSCFISQSTEDKSFTRRLHADLLKNGIRCCFAQEDLEIGAKTRERIDELIRAHDKLILVLSNNAINSEWVEKEVETAMDIERKKKRAVLLPIRIDDAIMRKENGWAADIWRQRHVGDFCFWKNPDAYNCAFNRLLKDLKSEA